MEEAGAALEEEERQMIRGVMEMEFTAIREVMVPRPDMIAVDVTDGFEKVAHLMVDRGFSRLPIYEENVDNIIGIAHGKEIMRHLARNGRQPDPPRHPPTCAVRAGKQEGARNTGGDA